MHCQLCNPDNFLPRSHIASQPALQDTASTSLPAYDAMQQDFKSCHGPRLFLLGASTRAHAALKGVRQGCCAQDSPVKAGGTMGCDGSMSKHSSQVSANACKPGSLCANGLIDRLPVSGHCLGVGEKLHTSLAVPAAHRVGC